MGLDSNIVIVNEFTKKSALTGKGSRGSTPGSYVLRYMAREDAVENMAPVRSLEIDDYIQRYMMRENAVEPCETPYEATESISALENLSGVAFGSYNASCGFDISMSREKVKDISKRIQNAYENGKTVLKTVVSFTHEYLQERGVVPSGFEPDGPGSYRGNVDQMKLRRAISRGVEAMSRDFDDLAWIGVIQVDTNHVHCHLCLVDEGEGQKAIDGTQKGKLSKAQMIRFRRGLDNELIDLVPLRQLSQDITCARQNVKTLVRDKCHVLASKQNALQMIKAVLPEDRSLWRAGSNSEEMRRANVLTREYVEKIFQSESNVYQQAMMAIGDYAKKRAESGMEGEYNERGIIERNRERMIHECMNTVYDVIKDIPEEEFSVSTPMLDIMSVDYDSLAAHFQENASVDKSDSIVEFGLRLRTYSSRLDYHKKQKNMYRQAVSTYDRQVSQSSNVDPKSIALRQFYAIEEEYNLMLMNKYQHFLAFFPPEEDYEEEFELLTKKRKQYLLMEQLINDEAFKLLNSSEEAEMYGRQTYGIRGGYLAFGSPNVYEQILDARKSEYEYALRDFSSHIEDSGMSVDTTDEGLLVVKKKLSFDFDTVKALDLHHMDYDFPFDIEVSHKCVNDFQVATDVRYEAFKKAERYLIGSGQADRVQFLPKKDIENMRDVAAELGKSNVLISVPAETRGFDHVRTIRTDKEYDGAVRDAIERTIENISLGD